MVTVFGKIPASIILGLDGDKLVYSADGKSWLEFDEYTKAEVNSLLSTKANTGVTDGLDARISDLEDSLGNLEKELAKI